MASDPMKSIAKKKRKVKRKKSANPRIKRKAKRKLSKQKRSQAAKKGWETRKKKRAQREQEAQQQVIARKAKAYWEGKRPDLRGVEKVFEEVMAELRPGEEYDKSLRHVFAEAFHRSVEEQLPELRSQLAEGVIEEFIEEGYFVESDETRIIGRLMIADEDGRFDDEARILADEFDYDVHDIYDMWHGYGDAT